jgi:hypothetical protein
MIAPRNTDGDPDSLLNNFASEMTEATYPIALKYGIAGASLVDLEVEVWKTVTELVRTRGTVVLRLANVNSPAGVRKS